MKSLVDYYLMECVNEDVDNIVMDIVEANISGVDVELKDEDDDGIVDDVVLGLDKVIDTVSEGMKARAPKLVGKAEKGRKNKAKIMGALMKNPLVQDAIGRLKKILLRTAKQESSKLGVNNRAVTKALAGKVRI